jgi:hypothetical protein
METNPRLKMALIKVNEKDHLKVFEILLNHGPFSGIRGNMFRIEGYADEALERIKKAGIKVRML